MRGFCLLMILLTGCAPRRTPAPLGPPDMGRARFESYCAGCHLNEGPWMRGEAPPLENSSWVSGPEERLIRIAMHGLRGLIEVDGRRYNQEMPGIGAVLSDGEIAALLSHVRGRFGGGPVSTGSVARIRAAHPGRTELWTVDELLKEP
jgi:mono/diheme cytochrome c family protein